MSVRCPSKAPQSKHCRQRNPCSDETGLAPGLEQHDAGDSQRRHPRNTLAVGKHEHDTDKYNFDGSHSSQSVLVREDSAISNGAGVHVDASRRIEEHDHQRQHEKYQQGEGNSPHSHREGQLTGDDDSRDRQAHDDDAGDGGVPGQCRPVPAGCRDAGRDHKREDRPRRIA